VNNLRKQFSLQPHPGLSLWTSNNSHTVHGLQKVLPWNSCHLQEFAVVLGVGLVVTLLVDFSVIVSAYSNRLEVFGCYFSAGAVYLHKT